MSTTDPLTSSHARNTPETSGADPEQRVDWWAEEGTESDFSDGEERSHQREGNMDNQKAVAEKAAAAVPGRPEIGERLKGFIGHRGQGLQSMYGEKGEEQNRRLEGPIIRGEEMARRLITEKKCPGEIARYLIVLTLYDVAILIDDSDSMISEEGGKKKETLAELVGRITEICSMANDSGTLAVKLMNSAGDIKTWTREEQKNLSQHSHGGLTKIGTELKKILDKFGVGNPKQSKPLLVVIVTDGAVEGERKGHLKNVIRNCLNKCEDDKRSDVVAFQFSRIGNDPDGDRLLKELDDDPSIGDCIDVFEVGIDLEGQLKDEWFMVPKILIGAILDDWDKQDEYQADHEEESNSSGEEWDN